MSFTKYTGFAKPKDLEQQIIKDLKQAFDWDEIKRELEEEDKVARDFYRKEVKRNLKVSGWEPSPSQQRFLAFDLETVSPVSSTTGVWFSNTTTAGPSTRQETAQEDVEEVNFDE